MKFNIKEVIVVDADTKQKSVLAYRQAATHNDKVNGRVREEVNSAKIAPTHVYKKTDVVTPDSVIRVKEVRSARARLNKRERKGVEQDVKIKALSTKTPVASATFQNVDKRNVQIENTKKVINRPLEIEPYLGERNMCMKGGQCSNMSYTLSDKKSKLLANLNN